MTSEDRKQDLENRAKILELNSKVTETRAARIRLADESRKRALEIRKQELDNESIKLSNKEKEDNLKTGGWGNSKVMNMVYAISAWKIDNDKTTIGSEPAVRSIWTEDEVEMLKAKLLKLL